MDDLDLDDILGMKPDTRTLDKGKRVVLGIFFLDGMLNLFALYMSQFDGFAVFSLGQDLLLMTLLYFGYPWAKHLFSLLILRNIFANSILLLDTLFTHTSWMLSSLKVLIFFHGLVLICLYSYPPVLFFLDAQYEKSLARRKKPPST